jgi:hypothetical protein
LSGFEDIYQESQFLVQTLEIKNTKDLNQPPQKYHYSVRKIFKKKFKK